MIRIDLLLKDKLNISRQKAQQLVSEGAVLVNGNVVSKPSQQVEETAEISVNENSTLKYVGRGGLKLEGAIAAFNLDFNGCVCVDIGASTGGFTDCMLKNGATRVYAVDVGTEQLAQALRDDDRVCCYENTNIMDFDCPEKADFITTDVSFVSITKILPDIDRLLGNGCAVVLVKPQFEAGRQHLSKNGIVRDLKVHKNVLNNVISQAAIFNLYCGGLCVSPIRGGDGNIEYLLFLTRRQVSTDIRMLVENAVKQAKG